MEPIKYHTFDEGVRRGLLVKRTNKYIRLILMQYPIKVTRVPVAEYRNMSLLDYPISKLKKALRKAAREWRCDLSKECKLALRGK